MKVNDRYADSTVTCGLWVSNVRVSYSMHNPCSSVKGSKEDDLSFSLPSHLSIQGDLNLVLNMVKHPIYSFNKFSNYINKIVNIRSRWPWHCLYFDINSASLRGAVWTRSESPTQDFM